jgi:hypothetical protein
MMYSMMPFGMHLGYDIEESSCTSGVQKGYNMVYKGVYGVYEPLWSRYRASLIPCIVEYTQILMHPVMECIRPCIIPVRRPRNKGYTGNTTK